MHESDDAHRVPGQHQEQEQEQEQGANNRERHEIMPLPLPLPSFVGRGQEVQSVKSLLQSGEVRLLTLTGPGGVGKTRLALQVAADSRASYADGIFFVSLATVTDPDHVLSTISQTLGIRESSGQSLFEAICSALHSRSLLLILDNFERVVSAGPRVVDLLVCAPGLRVLVTSRTVLRVYGEQEYPVLPLSLPTGGEGTSARHLSQYEAVRLFIERARAARPSFTVDDTSAPAVAEICHRLDGLPLAIELAAARIKLMSPQALLLRLDRRLPVLTGGAVNLPARHQALRDTVAWSYDLLTEDERKLFRCVSVFAGGCTLDAVEAVCCPGNDQGSAENVLDRLSALADKSLLRYDEQDDGQPRFSMLQTIREYAQERLEETGEGPEVETRHSEYFLQWAEQARPELIGPDQLWWLDRLALEHDNMRAVLERAHLQGDAETALRVGAGLFYFWYTRGFLTEGRKWLSQALEHSENAPAKMRGEALNALGNLSGAQGDYEAARSCHQRVLAIAQEGGDTRQIAVALSNLGNTARLQGDYAGARALREQGLALLATLEQTQANRVANLIAVNLYDMGTIAWMQGDASEARRFCEEALQEQRRLGDKRGIASTLNRLAEVVSSEGQNEEARAYEDEALALSRELRDKAGIARSLRNLGEIAANGGDFASAYTFLAEALRIRYDLGNKRNIAECLSGLATVEREQSEPARLTTLLGAADALFSETVSPLSPRDRDHHEKWLAFARAKLSPEAFAAAWDEGRAMRVENAVALALEPPAFLSAPSSSEGEPTPRQAAAPGRARIARARAPGLGPDARDELTARELEVLRLVSAGFTNPEIAAHLHLSINTVQTHLRSIFSKINVSTRSAAVRFAFEHNMN